MTLHNSTQNSMPCQAWRAQKQNSMTFQVFQDLHEPVLIMIIVILMLFEVYGWYVGRMFTVDICQHIFSINIDVVIFLHVNLLYS